MSGHTPGPWTVYPDNGYFNIGAGKDDCDVVSSEGISDEANARLIAASPCLLAALKALMKSIHYDSCEESDTEENWTEYQAAQAAIAKAEGKQ